METPNIPYRDVVPTGFYVQHRPVFSRYAGFDAARRRTLKKISATGPPSRSYGAAWG
jgi:hypothetical protein